MNLHVKTTCVQDIFLDPTVVFIYVFYCAVVPFDLRPTHTHTLQLPQINNSLQF